MPQFTATFVPSGYDDYSMPEMYAPAPQRVMPEVPQNMQQDIQRMEFEAGHYPSRQQYGAAPNHGHDRGESLSSAVSSYTDGSSSNYRPFEDDHHNYRPMASLDMPGKNPFPRLKGDNIPPSDDEKEEILYNAREHVLHSNNVNMQLSWARDALNFVETASEVRAREDAARNGGRSQTPAVEHELRVDAMNIIMYLSEQHHPEAVFMKAKWDEFGKFGTREDKRAAFKGYRTAAEQGWGRAEYRMGMLYENSNEFDKAISHYYNGERLGDSAAMYRLGMMALLGQHGQRQDFQRGLDWINRAADTADEDAPQGAYVFGMLIARDLPDINVPEGMLPYKVDTARQYIEKAAYLGFAKAQLKMGQAYELCQLGCDFHPAYSLHYYGLASAQGQPEAALGVSRWFLFGYEGNFAKNEALAFKYAKQAADAKLPTGEFAMGYYHEIGIHIQKDLSEARRWYGLAAQHGNTDAVGRLDSLSHDQSLSKQDHETTALTRIKSQHGSMRGKRPERLKRLKDQQHMAAVPEGPTTPNDPNGRSPRVSPHPSPRHGPAGSDSRPPAFGLNVNIDQGGLAMRPKSAAPYPEDDTRPNPLNVNRPRSAAPYPEEGPGYLPPMRNAGGLPAPGGIGGRPDAFGIRPGSAGRGVPGPANLAPGVIPAGMPPPRARVASGGAPGGPQGGYRQGSPAGGHAHAGSGGYGRGGMMMGGPRPAGAPPGNGAGRGMPGPYGQGGPPGPQSPPLIPPAGSMPGTPSREYGGGRGANNPYGPPAAMGGPGPQGGGGGAYPPRQSSQPQPQQQRPGFGRSSAPPLHNAVAARPTPPSSSHGPGTASPAASVASAPPAASKPSGGKAGKGGGGSSHPDGKTMGNGPSTFDEMGIPKAKDKDDCTYEQGALYSIRARDPDAFTRYVTQLAPFYELPASVLPPNLAERNRVTGLYLLLLLTQGRYAEFHSELESLSTREGGGGSVDVEGDRFLGYPIRLERWLMEGSYDRVWKSMKSREVPSEEFAVFSEILTSQIRSEIASSSERAYPSLPISSTKSLLFLDSEGAVIDFARSRGWILRDGMIYFPKETEADLLADGDEGEIDGRDEMSKLVIENALGYARELETIV
ncbi:hypothetical protein VMCG_03737 [Cytospora schulzeri]|uniref:PCI domain-containing protein n=1 Tax=Cytospora schulzeri TaxID=448051 RepID=A0A423WV55_9PEZI|nr:hypothetical protein VMCG_03737 [Valsa malicola]